MSGSVARPQRLVVVGGTGTEVGKTWVGCELARHLRGLGQQVSARKLAQSFGPEEGPTDAERLAAATGEKAADVCPPWRWYPRAMAPPMAAEALGLPPFGLDDLVGELRWPPGVDVGLVEWAGGVGLAPGHLRRCRRPGRAAGARSCRCGGRRRAGALSNVRLAARALSRHPLAVFLNHFDDEDDLHGRNRRWLAERDGLRVFVSTAGLAEVVVTA